MNKIPPKIVSYDILKGKYIEVKSIDYINKRIYLAGENTFRFIDEVDLYVFSGSLYPDGRPVYVKAYSIIDKLKLY